MSPVDLIITYVGGWTVAFVVLGTFHVWRRKTNATHEVPGPVLMAVFVLTAIAIGSFLG